jgi:hypothetical protein
MGGYSSHVTLPFINYCDRYNIILLILPPIVPLHCHPRQLLPAKWSTLVSLMCDLLD